MSYKILHEHNLTYVHLCLSLFLSLSLPQCIHNTYHTFTPLIFSLLIHTQTYGETDDYYMADDAYRVSACVEGTDCTDCGGVDAIPDYTKVSQLIYLILVSIPISLSNLRQIHESLGILC